MTKHINRFLYRSPRVMAILFMLFIAMFSLDVFDGNYGFRGTILALFMHNIPTFILLIVTIIAWKREMVGAVAFFLFALVYIVSTAIRASTSEMLTGQIVIIRSLIIAGPAIVTGGLFLANRWKKKDMER